MKTINTYIVEKFKISKDINNSVEPEVLVKEILSIVIENGIKPDDIDKVKNCFTEWIKDNKINSLHFYYDTQKNTDNFEQDNVSHSKSMVEYYTKKSNDKKYDYYYIDMRYSFLPNKGNEKKDLPTFVYCSTPYRRFIIVCAD